MSNARYNLFPSKPAFMAYGSPSTSDSSYQELSWSYTNTNVGNHFSTSSNRFTAPESGEYFFTTSILADDTNAATHLIQFYKNGSVFNVQTFQRNTVSTGSDHTSSISCVVHLDEDDYFSVYAKGTWDSSQSSGMVSYNTFSGFLVS